MAASAFTKNKLRVSLGDEKPCSSRGEKNCLFILFLINILLNSCSCQNQTRRRKAKPDIVDVAE